MKRIRKIWNWLLSGKLEAHEYAHMANLYLELI